MNMLKKNQVVNILPEDVKGASAGRVLKSLKKFVEIEISEKDVPFYKLGCPVEVFTAVEDGMLYFESMLESSENNILKIKSAENYEILQRREFTRIPLEKKITLKDEDIKCKCLDISAGGMKLETDKQLDMEKDYTVSFSLENNISINCYLRPIRITKDKKSKYIVSGRFVLLKNIDKIAIVQYCFKKQIEDRNR